ncbi:Alcohol dehydrogenase [Labilithrix luteola]|uniref:alcohol dehydrogenase n=1 Tax=Labilithrix luteola TaxID=1391654 RepID=A0A0K1PSK4_9BACT|nr:zinc-binding dehydrogenase [Labilithrix luteola]AKU96346.1 Alcohol dehydrogenase [Labilithrix luteola]
MKAVILREFGGPENLRFECVPDPVPGHGEVLLRIRACGVCYHDLIARRGRLGGIPPMILGHEVVGEVIGIGDGVEGWSVGDRAATLQRMSCGSCEFCEQKRNSLCKVDRRFFGEEIPGGYAPLMAAPVLGLCPVPDSLSWPDAATVCCTTGTAVHVCRTRGRIRDGETVLVTGASGGVGLQAVQICRLSGAKVIAVTTSHTKVGALEASGADHVVVAPDLDFAPEVKRITSGAGVDVALEIVGSAAFGQTLKCLAPGGRLVIVGNLDTASVDLNPGLVIVKELEIIGAYATTREEMALAFELTAKGHVKSCVSEVLPLQEAGSVHFRLENRQISGRAVLVPDDV